MLSVSLSKLSPSFFLSGLSRSFSPFFVVWLLGLSAYPFFYMIICFIMRLSVHVSVCLFFHGVINNQKSIFAGISFGTYYLHALQTWQDRSLIWSPSQYGNLTRINLPVDTIWTPPVGLLNSWVKTLVSSLSITKFGKLKIITMFGRGEDKTNTVLYSGSRCPGAKPGPVIAFCSWIRNLTLAFPKSSQAYEWLSANYQGSLLKC